jgi:hypothetical protein
MTLHFRPLRTVALCAFLLPVAGGASALDADAISERLKTAFANQTLDFDWQSAELDGDTLTLEGVTINPDGQTRIDVGTITLEGIEEDDGDYTVETVTLPSFTDSREGITMEFSGMTITGLELPDVDPASPEASVMAYESATIDRVSFGAAGAEVFTLTGFAVEMDPREEGDPVAFSGSAQNIRADLSTVLDGQSLAVMDEMGYTQFEGSMEMAGSWSPTDGRTALDTFDITIADAGTIGLAFEVSGYTPAFMKALQDMQRQSAAQPGGQMDAAQSMAMLGLMQQLTFIRAEISFDNDQLTERALDFMADQQSVERGDVAGQAKAMLPFVLMQLNDPAFTASVSSAVSAYLDDPQNLTIRAAPAAPVPMALLAAGAMSAPQALIQQLNVTVTANE